MDHYTEIYQKQTDKYHRMISFEDVENNLLKTIRALVPLNGKNILDLGSGTGRLSQLTVAIQCCGNSKRKPGSFVGIGI